MEIISEKVLSKKEAEQKIWNVAVLCRIENFLERHPYDLSGGERQCAALAKVLLTEPEILLLDEPTKGMDSHFKEEFADILTELKENGVTVLMISHDIEFCAEYADRCALFFDGAITSIDAPREFFKGKSFYTTSANRMARTIIPDAILAEDIVSACGAKIKKKRKQTRSHNIYKLKNNTDLPKENTKKISPARIIAGCMFALLFAITSLLFYINISELSSIPFLNSGTLRIFAIIEITAAFFCFFSQKKIEAEITNNTDSDRKITKRTIFSAFLILLLIPLTIYIGILFFDDRRYYFVSLLIILETMLPFLIMFESRRPQAREIIIISVLCAVALAGRAAFFMLPQFKPVTALVIISGICFGGETGFLVGSVTGFISNLFFGLGPWAPWQMFAFGIIGFIAGILFKTGVCRNKFSLCVFGFLSTLIIYGGIMNPASVIMWQNKITWKMIVTAFAMGLPFDLIHALSTAFFLWFLTNPMVEKLERIKTKYGLMKK